MTQGWPLAAKYSDTTNGGDHHRSGLSGSAGPLPACWVSPIEPRQPKIGLRRKIIMSACPSSAAMTRPTAIMSERPSCRAAWRRSSAAARPVAVLQIGGVDHEPSISPSVSVRRSRLRPITFLPASWPNASSVELPSARPSPDYQ